MGKDGGRCLVCFNILLLLPTANIKENHKKTLFRLSSVPAEIQPVGCLSI